MANTMAMTARERLAEYATLKALGFGPGYVARLIFGESLAIALVGGRARHRADVPGRRTGSATQMGTLFPVFEVSAGTVALQVGAARSWSAIAAALRPGAARRARADRRWPARHRVDRPR